MIHVTAFNEETLTPYIRSMIYACAYCDLPEEDGVVAFNFGPISHGHKPVALRVEYKKSTARVTVLISLDGVPDSIRMRGAADIRPFLIGGDCAADQQDAEIASVVRSIINYAASYAG